MQDRWPEMPPPRSRAQQPAQPAQPTQPTTQAQPANPASDSAAPTAKPKPAAAAAAAPGNTVTCGGAFGKDSTHLKLAIKYDSRNVAFTDVDGPDGSKIKATVLYPNDPKRRLEVLWNNDAARSDTQLVVITGQSKWTAPKGLKLGMPLAALEKANGRPFKMNGFGPDGTASVVDWAGGALASLPGGCKLGVRLAAADASGAAGDRELMSNDASLKASKATVSELLIGY